MIRSILVDDEVDCLDTLNILLTDHCPEVEIVDRCMSVQQGVAAIHKHQPALVFLDIEMPSLTGLYILQQLPVISFAVICTTNYDQYAIKGIRFGAMDYLVKPIDPTELVLAVKKVQSRNDLPLSALFEMLMNQYKHRDTAFHKIAVPTAEGFELIYADQLIRCEANDNYTWLFLKDKTRIVACRTLKEIGEQLSEFGAFTRVHHSYIVNLNEVIRYIRGEGGYLVMSDGATVNVSRSRKEALLKLF